MSNSICVQNRVVPQDLYRLDEQIDLRFEIDIDDVLAKLVREFMPMVVDVVEPVSLHQRDRFGVHQPQQRATELPLVLAQDVRVVRDLVVARLRLAVEAAPVELANLVHHCVFDHLVSQLVEPGEREVARMRSGWSLA